MASFASGLQGERERGEFVGWGASLLSHFAASRSTIIHMRPDIILYRH